ncbi:hypothetical protein AOLI_G00043540 [Acnodon oligacanthus]
MLGLQETKSAGTPPSKTYSCVACSATFKGLSSLLVHQASHASEISDQRVASLPSCSHCGSLFANTELLQKHHCIVLPPLVPQDVNVCERGEEFLELGFVQEHKSFHEVQVTPQLEETNNETLELVENSELAQMDCSQPVPDEVPSNENSPYHCTNEALQDTQTASEACLSASVSPVNGAVSQEHHDDGSKPSSPLALTEAQDQSLGNKIENVTSENTCVSDSEETPNESQESSNKKPLLKMLTFYLNSRQSTQKHWERNKRTLPPCKVSTRAPVQAPAVMPTSSSGYFMNNVTEGGSKCGIDGVGFGQSGNLLNVKPVEEKNKSKIISMTKILYPVVAIEASQQLLRKNLEGGHQCGLCRRIFQDTDSLIMHHALHKKERVKYCRRCRQYVISVISVPHNHICASPNVGFSEQFSLPTSSTPTTQHSRKLFHCTKCNRSYARRHTLNRHNCQWIALFKSSGFGAQKDKISRFEEGSNAVKQLMSVEQDSSCQVNVGVNTEGLKLVKPENLNTDSSLEAKYQRGLLAKRFSRNAEPTAAQDEMSRGRNTETGEPLGASQCTVPLDDAEIHEMDVNEEKHDAVMEAPKDNSDRVVVLEPTIKCPTNSSLSSKDFQVHISATGVKRFSCNRCQRSYSRHFTLKQHLEICGARKLMERNSFGKANIIALKKNFPCPTCGVLFTHKDRMNMHQKRCQSVRSASILEANKLSEKKNQASQENIFVLSQVSKNQVRQKSSDNNSEIMSLPSVLPRKVTCECGAAFTCPRLLFEHLQLHTMESYICSHCGENWQSWADYQAHQKFHAQTPGQKNEQKVSQPQLQQEPRFQMAAQNRKNQPQDLLKSHLNHNHVCQKCKKVFGAHKSLLRHLRLSCRGDIAGGQNKHSCSRCGMTFQSPLAHKVHVQGNTCTPSFKPVRCPVCVRWFSCMDGLKRHLVSHSQQKVLTCQICEHKCSSHEDLEEHKRRVHGTKQAAESPTIQSAHVSQSNPSNAFQCQIFPPSYPKHQSLKDHLRKVHQTQGLNPGSVGVFETKAGGLQSSKGTVQQSHSARFQCHICSRSYPDLKSLKNHRRRIHCIRGGLEMFREIVHQSQGTSYRCQSCHQIYRDAKSLKNHRRRVHRILGDVPESAEAVSTDVEESEDHSEPLDVTLSPSTPPETAVQ